MDIINIFDKPKWYDDYLDELKFYIQKFEVYREKLPYLIMSLQTYERFVDDVRSRDLTPINNGTDEIKQFAGAEIQIDREMVPFGTIGIGIKEKSVEKPSRLTVKELYEQTAKFVEEGYGDSEVIVLADGTSFRAVNDVTIADEEWSSSNKAMYIECEL